MINKLRKLADWLECNKAKRYVRWNDYLDSKKLDVNNCKNCVCAK